MVYEPYDATGYINIDLYLVVYSHLLDLLKRKIPQIIVVLVR